MGDGWFARSGQACMALVGLSLSGCGALLGVDHDWELVDAEVDSAALPDALAVDSGGDGMVVDGSDSSAPGADTASIDAPSLDAAVDGACPVGALSCSGPQPQICTNSGTWQNVGAACTGDAPACLGGACVACTPGSSGCTGQQPEQCDSTGAWKSTGAACSNQACVDGGCTGTCSPGALECLNTYWFVCNSSGGWQLVGTQC